MEVALAFRYVLSVLVNGRSPLPPGIKIGKDVFIDRTAILDRQFGKHITLCDGAAITHKALLLCHDRSSKGRIAATWIAPIYVGENAFIGANSILLPGTRIGKDAIVAAGAVVSGNVEPGVIVAGVPAKPIGRVEDLDRKRLENMKKMKLFDWKIIYNKSAKIRNSIDNDQLLAVEKDGGYFVVFDNTSNVWMEGRREKNEE